MEGRLTMEEVLLIVDEQLAVSLWTMYRLMKAVRGVRRGWPLLQRRCGPFAHCVDVRHWRATANHEGKHPPSRSR